MILEWLESLATPASPLARRLGFLTSALQVRARHSRCRTAWLPHLRASQNLILQAADRCSSHRKVLLLGAGLLHDIPLAALAQRFQTVLLADIVHPLSTRLALRRFPNVFPVSCDLTDVMHHFLPPGRHALSPPKCQNTPQSTPQNESFGDLPTSFPTAFCSEPDLDLTVSVNLLSQLTWIPNRLLSASLPPDSLDAFCRHLLQAHLDYLLRLPGHTALITDYAWSRLPLPKAPSPSPETWDVLRGLPLPTPDAPDLRQSWNWIIAPAPEREPHATFIAHVAAYPDWKAVAPLCPPT